MDISSNTNQIDIAALSTKRKIVALTNELNASQLNALLSHTENFIKRFGDSYAAEGLSKREREVLLLLSEGYSRREIGAALTISSNTAATHITNIYQKIGASSVAEATRYALYHNI